MTAFILNLTTKEFYRYGTNEDYAETLKSLITPLKMSEAIIQSDIGLSHWVRTDKIIYVPEHLIHYVLAKYNEIYIQDEVKYHQM